MRLIKIMIMGLSLTTQLISGESQASEKLHCQVLLAHFPAMAGEKVPFFKNNLRSKTLRKLQDQGINLVMGPNYFDQHEVFYQQITADFEKVTEKNKETFKQCKVRNMRFAGEKFRGNVGYKILAALSLPVGVLTDIFLSVGTLGVYPLLNVLNHAAFGNTLFVTESMYETIKSYNDVSGLSKFLDEENCNEEGLRKLLVYKPTIICR